MIEVKLTFYIENDSEDNEQIWAEFKKQLDTCRCPEEFIQWRTVDPKTYMPIEETNGTNNF